MIKYPFRFFRRVIGSLYFLVFLNGFLLASLFYFKMDANYENQLFNVIQKSIDKKVGLDNNKDSILIKIMQTCSDLLRNRAMIFNGSKDLEGFKADFIHPASIDLMTARGECGSYSLVLARILQNYHYPVRIAQMKAHGRYGAHNIIEANINSQWIVLDPLFDTYFIKPDGKNLASFLDVKNNWGYYSKQLPSGYDSSYKYEDVRYTNWDKIPVILPALKKILEMVLGKERTESISLRVHFLRMYDLYFFIALFIYIPVFFFTLRKMIKKKLFPQYEMPITLHNVKKYAIPRIQDSRLKKSI